MKVGIIGGGGIVGASAGFALQLGGIVHEIVIVDTNADLADGQALQRGDGLGFGAGTLEAFRAGSSGADLLLFELG